MVPVPSLTTLLPGGSPDTFRPLVHLLADPPSPSPGPGSAGSCPRPLPPTPSSATLLASRRSILAKRIRAWTPSGSGLLGPLSGFGTFQTFPEPGSLPVLLPDPGPPFGDPHPGLAPGLSGQMQCRQDSMLAVTGLHPAVAILDRATRHFVWKSPGWTTGNC